MYRPNLGVVRAGTHESNESCFTGNHAIVARLRDLRQQLEDEMAPDPWTDLEVSAVTPLADVCDALRLTPGEKKTVLGSEGQHKYCASLESRIQPQPLNARQVYALAEAQRHGRLTNGDPEQLLPYLSPETLRLDLAGLVRRGSLRRHGRCRGMIYTAAE